MVRKEEISGRLRGIIKNRWRAVVVLVLVAVVGFIGWRALGARSQQSPYQTAIVERGTIVAAVSASGKALTTNIVEITTQASGVVKAVYVHDDDRVTAGQKIAEITLDRQGQQNHAQAWSSYLSAKNSVASAKASQYSLQSEMFSKWKTFKELSESSSYDTAEERGLPQFHIAEKDWLAAEAKYKNQEGGIAQAQAALKSAWLSYLQSSPIVTAPIAGTIGSLGFVEGMVIGSETSSSTSDQTSTSQRVAVVQNEGRPVVSVTLAEIDVPRVQVGQNATIVFDSLSQKTFTGKVVTIDKIGTTSNNVTSYSVNILLSTGSSAILPSMAATANIIVETKSEVLLVPSAAVQTQGEQTSVRVLRNGREEQVPVTVGISSDTQTEIVSGLSEGDMVITGSASTASTQAGTGGSVFGGFGGGAFRLGGTGGGVRRD
ncbi:MAG: hypothetical protein A2900_00635 [Candidatus Chisholmbacteria bacterium RIFCSPLOWO2_01_FULL_50_28]|nr:MAG: hypothetical protein A2900_00635 [Candidatus Chisholmbacteria bacterium RIFCSPLOWO2_01_FULL_50_28]